MEGDELLDDAFRLLGMGHELEDSNPIMAGTHFLQACYLMKHFLCKDMMEPDTRKLISSKIKEYERRASDLIRSMPRSPVSSISFMSSSCSSSSWGRDMDEDESIQAIRNMNSVPSKIATAARTTPTIQVSATASTPGVSNKKRDRNLKPPEPSLRPASPPPLLPLEDQSRNDEDEVFEDDCLEDIVEHPTEVESRDDSIVASRSIYSRFSGSSSRIMLEPTTSGELVFDPNHGKSKRLDFLPYPTTASPTSSVPPVPDLGSNPLDSMQSLRSALSIKSKSARSRLTRGGGGGGYTSSSSISKKSDSKHSAFSKQDSMTSTISVLTRVSERDSPTKKPGRRFAWHDSSISVISSDMESSSTSHSTPIRKKKKSVIAPTPPTTTKTTPISKRQSSEKKHLGRRRSPSPVSLLTDDTVVPMPVPSPRSILSTSKVVNKITEIAAKANSRLASALDLDEAEDCAMEAIDEYIAAAELYFQSIKIAEENNAEHMIASLLRQRLEGVIDRVEQLKKGKGIRSFILERRVQRDVSKQAVGKNTTWTDKEVKVLLLGSVIASGKFLPWSEEEAEKLNHEHTHSSILIDKKLKLNDSQLERFHTWARAPSDYEMVRAVSPYTIKQEFVTDCSFVASLCVCAHHERRFGKRLVTSILYPQDEFGMPVVSRSGEYMVKLWLNGVARQVKIDGELPFDCDGKLLCSHTRYKELWVSLIEKAYMKLCGGYDFPGSNSGVDLFSLTGWIPERVFFPEDPHELRDHETPAERVWERLYAANCYGDCLITMSSSPNLNEEHAASMGLVTGHAYAVLNVVKTSIGTRLLQLKNPWAHKGWKGRYSCHDRASWTERLCAEVGYDRKRASQYDDGVFWICWEDVLTYFQNLHLNWNPDLFTYSVTTHGYWPENQGPAVDQFNVGENPQYILTFSDEALEKKATVWVLLSRHVNKQEQHTEDVSDYLTVHLHRNENGRRRIWFPSSKTCMKQGAYTNNPHVMIRYDLTEPEDKHLSLVLSQYKKSHDLCYTLSCYSTSPFKLGHPEKELPFRFEIDGEWTVETAGGPPDQVGFGNNPQWKIKIAQDVAKLQIRVKTNRSMTVNVMLIGGDGKHVSELKEDPVMDSGNYRHGFAVADTKMVPVGLYTLVCSTFQSGVEGNFSIDIFSSTQLKIEPI